MPGGGAPGADGAGAGAASDGAPSDGAAGDGAAGDGAAGDGAGAGVASEAPQLPQNALGSVIGVPQLWQYCEVWFISSLGLALDVHVVRTNAAVRPGLPAASHPATPTTSPSPKAASAGRRGPAARPGPRVSRRGTSCSWICT